MLASELHKIGYTVSYPVVAELLAESGYSLQSNLKAKEGSRHPDRNAQFEHINQAHGSARGSGAVPWVTRRQG